MNLRPYTGSDLEAVIAIFRSNIPKYFGPDEEPGLRSFLSDPRCTNYLVGEIDNEVVASGGIALNNDRTVSLCWGMVHADHIGTGLGRHLTIARISLARDKFGALPLSISTSQHTSAFYAKFGFRATSRQKDGFGPGIDRIDMRLDV